MSHTSEPDAFPRFVEPSLGPMAESQHPKSDEQEDEGPEGQPGPSQQTSGSESGENEEEEGRALGNWTEERSWRDGVEMKGAVREVVPLGGGELFAFVFVDGSNRSLRLFDVRERTTTQFFLLGDEGVDMKGERNTLAIQYSNKAFLVFKVLDRWLVPFLTFLPRMREGGFTVSVIPPPFRRLDRLTCGINWYLLDYGFADGVIAIRDNHDNKTTGRTWFYYSTDTGELLRSEPHIRDLLIRFSKDYIFKVTRNERLSWEKLSGEGGEAVEVELGPRFEGWKVEEVEANEAAVVAVGVKRRDRPQVGARMEWWIGSWDPRSGGTPLGPPFLLGGPTFITRWKHAHCPLDCCCLLPTLHPSQASVLAFGHREGFLSLVGLEQGATLWEVPLADLSGFPLPLSPSTLLLPHEASLSLLDLSTGSLSHLPAPFEKGNKLVFATSNLCIIHKPEGNSYFHIIQTRPK